MSLYAYFALFAVILLIGLAATLFIGNSKQNREGNPEYDRRTAGNWLRLSLFYIVVAAICIIGLLSVIYS
jgi:hypothetical protein